MRSLILLFPLVFLSFPALSQEQRGLSLSGDARMGIVWSAPDPRLRRLEGAFTSRSRLHLRYQGETDGGTRFGFNVDLDPDTRRPRSRQVFLGQ
jgi:hypothetical protein